jgi:2-phosphosulfolactate phosphatase
MLKKPLFVYMLPELAFGHWPKDVATAVVIDTLRFTTTVCQALYCGAAQIVAVAEIEAARVLAAQTQPRGWLCGERHCHRIEGFDLGNSPLEYATAGIVGATLIFSTTNGTRAIAAAQGADQVVLGALVNRAALCTWLSRSEPKPVVLLCAGTDGQIATEDVLTAGAIVELLTASDSHDNQFECGNDGAELARAAWKQVVGPTSSKQPSTSNQPSDLRTCFLNSLGGSNLLSANYEGDIDFALQTDTIDIVPVATADKTGQWSSATFQSAEL